MKKTLSLFLAGSIVILTLSGCSNISPSQNKGPEIIKIGVIAPLSGPAANYGEDAVNAYKYIADKFNSENSGKIQIELVIEDGKCEGKSAATAMQKLISVDKVQVVMSEVCSAAAIPADKIAQANKVVAISPVASAPEIANIGSYVYRFYNDANSTKKLSNYLDGQNIKSIALIVENTDYGIGYEKGIKNHFKGKIGFEEIFNSDEKDFNMIIKKLKQASDIEALVVIGNSDATNIPLFKSLQKEGLLEKFKGNIYGTEITATDSTIAEIGDLLEGVKVTELMGLSDMGVKANQLISDFKVNYQIKGVDFFVNLMGEALSLSLDAIKQNGYTSDGIKAHFDSFNANKLREGYFGKYYFSPERDAIGLDFMIYEIKKGKKIAIK